MSGISNVKGWLSRATPDYYTMFIKTWIPFNAWYVHAYNTTDDRFAIEQLKKEENSVRNRIESLLINDDTASKNFKYHLARLHLQLEERNLKHRKQKISFTQIQANGDELIEPSTYVDKNNNTYKASVGEGFYHLQIVSQRGKGKSLMDKKFSVYNLKALKEDSQYIGLNNAQIQKNIYTCYAAIDPFQSKSLLISHFASGAKIVLDSNLKISFVDDTVLISRSLIQVIYYLRCALFHGELDPTETNQQIYEHGFYLLQAIIKELS